MSQEPNRIVQIIPALPGWRVMSKHVTAPVAAFALLEEGDVVPLVAVNAELVIASTVYPEFTLVAPPTTAPATTKE